MGPCGWPGSCYRRPQGSCGRPQGTCRRPQGTRLLLVRSVAHSARQLESAHVRCAPGWRHNRPLNPGETKVRRSAGTLGDTIVGAPAAATRRGQRGDLQCETSPPRRAGCAWPRHQRCSWRVPTVAGLTGCTRWQPSQRACTRRIAHSLPGYARSAACSYPWHARWGAGSLHTVCAGSVHLRPPHRLRKV